jgi:hypothetical protein
VALRLGINPLDVRVIGALRAGLGVAMITRPSLVPRLLGADEKTAERVAWLAQMAGIREIVLGVGAVTASGRGARRWFVAGAACDALDAYALATAVRRRHVNVVGVGAVGTSLAAAAGGVAAVVKGARAS